MPRTTPTAFNRDRMAKQYAKRHMKIDSGVLEIHYLPTNAPPREIRLLEVNGIIPETVPLEPLDLGVTAGQADGHTLHVIDITPGQWKQVLSGRLQLPAGWSLANRQSFTRP